MIGRQAMRHARAAVVRQHLETIEAVVLHHRHRIGRHLALAVDTVLGIGRRPAGIAVAAQVHQDDRESLGQQRRNAVPDHMGLRMPMQQQQRGASATDTTMKHDAAAHHVEGSEFIQHRVIVRCCFPGFKQQSSN